VIKLTPSLANNTMLTFPFVLGLPAKGALQSTATISLAASSSLGREVLNAQTALARDLAIEASPQLARVPFICAGGVGLPIVAGLEKITNASQMKISRAAITQVFQEIRKTKNSLQNSLAASSQLGSAEPLSSKLDNDNQINSGVQIWPQQA